MHKLNHCFAMLLMTTAITGTCLGEAEAPADNAQNVEDAATAELRAGKIYMPTQVYTLKQDLEIIEYYKGLRVADVSDGMDQAGLFNSGLVSPDIGPLWRDTENYTHRIVGIAVTVRYVPTNLPKSGAMEPEKFSAWVGKWYNEHSPEPFTPLLREGSVLVIEDAMSTDVGTIGSNNIMGWKMAGCVGVVTSATARDTDEIIAQGNPLYLNTVGRGIRPGRNEIESVNRPVVVGGALVRPGDVIVADGDGVIVVPREHAIEVAKFAGGILATDKEERREKYEALDMELDDTVR